MSQQNQLISPISKQVRKKSPSLFTQQPLMFWLLLWLFFLFKGAFLIALAIFTPMHAMTNLSSVPMLCHKKDIIIIIA